MRLHSCALETDRRAKLLTAANKQVQEVTDWLRLGELLQLENTFLESLVTQQQGPPDVGAARSAVLVEWITNDEDASSVALELAVHHLKGISSLNFDLLFDHFILNFVDHSF